MAKKKVSAVIRTQDSGFTVMLTVTPPAMPIGGFQPDGIGPGWAGAAGASSMIPPQAPGAAPGAPPREYQPPATESTHAFTKIDEAFAFIAKQVENEE